MKVERELVHAGYILDGDEENARSGPDPARSDEFSMEPRLVPRVDPLEALLASGAGNVLFVPPKASAAGAGADANADGGGDGGGGADALGTEPGPGATSSLRDYVPTPGTIIYPGSFNPLHRGHTGLADLAQKILSVKEAGVGKFLLTATTFARRTSTSPTPIQV